MEVIMDVLIAIENPADPQGMYIFGYLKYLFFRDPYEKYNQLAGFLFIGGLYKNQAISYVISRFRKNKKIA